MPPQIAAFYGLLILSVSLAFLRGGEPEKIGALIILVMTVLQFGSLFFGPTAFHNVDLASLIVDVLGLAAFGAVAIYAMRVWPIWAASLQLLSLTSHFARNVDQSVEPLVYEVMATAPTFMVLLTLLLGTIFHRRRLHRCGADPSWKDW